MGKYKITTEDGTFTVEADNADDALAALDQTSAQNYMGATDKNGVPEGMVFDPATNRMVDTKALAQHEVPEGSWAGAAIKGLPFIGSYADEALGYLTSSSDTKNHPNESQQIQTDLIRQSQKKYEDENPKTALASKLAVGATALPAAIINAPALPTTGFLGGLMGRTLLGASIGGATGATEGAVSGYGEGEGDERKNNSIDRAKWGGALGTILGGVAPVVSQAATSVVRPIIDKFTVNRNLADLGISRPAADAVQRAMQADDALGPAGLARIDKAGPDAMLADAGESASALLDTTIQRSGRAGRIASDAVQTRAGATSGKLKGTMDLVLGQPPGMNAAAKAVYQRSAAARDAAYKAAYAKPIDYSSRAGRDIEDVFSRTPDSILGPAIKRANDTMKVRGMQNDQIMASIAEDGTVTLREMPNVVQADYLKRALNKMADEARDSRGIQTDLGVDAALLARQLRKALGDAVPEYSVASKLGGDTIEEKQAIELGASLLKPATTREVVNDAVVGMSAAEKKQAMLGLRQNIDDTMANVTRAISDPNVDARETAKILRDMSSKAAQEKMSALLGPQKTAILAKQIDEAAAALQLKASVSANSKTFARTEINRSVEDRGKDNVTRAFAKGEPLQVGKRLWQKATGADVASEQARSDAVYADIATLMTGARGQAAQDALQRLTDAYRTGALNQETARQVGRILSGGALLPSYQLSTQQLSK